MWAVTQKQILTHKQYYFLQCAMYMIALNIRKGIVWNVRTNEIYEIEIKNKRDFLNAVVKTITKRHTQNIF